MAIQVGGTTVIDNSRVLQNVTGLKTINNTSVLGSGNISASAAWSWTANQNGFQTVTGIPSTARELVIQVNDLRQNASNSYDYFNLRLGDSGGVESSGYSYYRQTATGTSYNYFQAEGTGSTSAWPIIFSIAWNSSHTLQWYLSSSDGKTWYMSGTGGSTGSGGPRVQSIAGRKTLSATLDRVQVYQNNTSYGYGGGFWRVGYR